MSVTLMDVLAATAELLQLDEVSEMLGSYGESTDGENVDAVDTRLDTDPDARLLTAAVKTAVYEINNDGFPSVKNMTVTPSDGVVTYEALGGEVLYIIKVTCGGADVEFRTVPRGICVGISAPCDVAYCEIPSGDMSYDDTVEVGGGIGLYAIAYRAARNYCLMSSRTDEASVWDQRYIEEAEKLRCRRRAFLPQRKWR